MANALTGPLWCLDQRPVSLQNQPTPSDPETTHLGESRRILEKSGKRRRRFARRKIDAIHRSRDGNPQPRRFDLAPPAESAGNVPIGQLRRALADAKCRVLESVQRAGARAVRMTTGGARTRSNGRGLRARRSKYRQPFPELRGMAIRTVGYGSGPHKRFEFVSAAVARVFVNWH